jgi:hypothetical protein
MSIVKTKHRITNTPKVRKVWQHQGYPTKYLSLPLAIVTKQFQEENISNKTKCESSISSKNSWGWGQGTDRAVDEGLKDMSGMLREARAVDGKHGIL